MAEMISVEAAADLELDRARVSPHGRSARALLHDGRLRHTLIALLDGQALGDHPKPEAATLHVLSGTMIVRADEGETRVETGQLVALPGPRHDVTAVGESVAILTTIAG
ncbi:cupin [Sinomonas sp.]|jgi:quercetin dioxygenase-like cupin family protein|uniref:cupin n=1 Tax=Sinomonas sp. TaxID=1914986 RepID=UPI003F7F5F94